MTSHSTQAPGLEMPVMDRGTDTHTHIQEKPENGAFPYAWRSNWDEAETEPLKSWVHLEWLCTNVIGGSVDVAYVVFERIDSKKRAAQVHGDPIACGVEVQSLPGRMQRVGRLGAKGAKRTLKGSDNGDLRGFASEVFDGREAAVIARRWLEFGLIDGYKRRHIWY